MNSVDAYLRGTRSLIEDTTPPTLSLAGQIADWIRERIQFGDIQPGEPIRETPIALQFGVSRGPVRDALKVLDRQRLVSLNRQSGAVVRRLSVEELTSLFRIRAELTGLMMRVVAETADRPLASLDAAVRGVHLLGAIAEDPRAPVAAYIQVRRRISDILHTITRSGYGQRIGRELEVEIALHWAAVFNKSRQLRSSAAWLRVAEALAARDADTAEREGRALVYDSLKELLRLHNDKLTESA